MEFDTFLKEMEEKLNILNIKADEKQIKKLYDYMNLLIEWNEKINLTAIIEYKEIITKHFIDSLTILKYVEKTDSIIDIGTGAGFPGIPLKIVNEDLNCTLLDSLNKRLNFLNEVIEKLELKNISTIHARAEELGVKQEHRERYDIAVSRAVAPLNVLLEYISPYVKVGGKCICMKGPNIEEELNLSKNAIQKLNLKIIKIENFVLVGTDNVRNIIVLEKTGKTKETYPRQSGKIKKTPL
jgi:16S rRNA (guanine527-N7)-methyltransferase